MYVDSQPLVTQLEKQLCFERLIATISTRFANLPPEDVDNEIVTAIRLVCEELALDRSAVGQVAPDGSGMVKTHSWAADGYSDLPNLSASDLPYTISLWSEKKEICFTRREELPPEAATDVKTFERVGTFSLVAFPMYTGSRLIGGVGFEKIHGEYEWPTQLVERLRLFSQLLANALAHKWAHRSLAEAYSRIEKLNEQLRRENIYLREEIQLEHVHREIIGNTEAIKRVLRQAEQVASTESTVLLLGETGTGKELVSRSIHEHSKRGDRPMIKVNCAALPSTLIESELFGREKGAYTGALSREIGRFELADNSTIFLDEIGELPLEIQSKLLRVLQEGEFERLGSSRTIRVNVRVIAATSRDLPQLVKERRFREDLYYRLNVFPIVIPPLRERRDDIPALVWHFIRELGGRVGRNVESISASNMKALQAYPWPGNIRELRNVIERSLIISTGPNLTVELPHDMGSGDSSETLEEVERMHIRNVLRKTQGRIRGNMGAAAVLGMKPSTLESRLKKLGIDRLDS